jgi:hypothetical protein
LATKHQDLKRMPRPWSRLHGRAIVTIPWPDRCVTLASLRFQIAVKKGMNTLIGKALRCDLKSHLFEEEISLSTLV